MTQKTFIDPREREILIVIDNDSILFYYAAHKRHDEMLLSEVKSRGGEYEERDYVTSEFYSIPKEHYVSDKTERLDSESNWQNHMNRKNWFTSEMKSFIDANT